MLPKKDEKNAVSWFGALVTLLVAWALLFCAYKYFGHRSLEGNTYSQVLHWLDIESNTALTMTPTWAPPEPMAIVAQGLSWKQGGGSEGVLLAWISLASLIACLVFIVGNRVFSVAAGALGALLFLAWPETWKTVLEGGSSLLAVFGLMLSIERVSARGTFGWSAALGIWMCGLVDPIAWIVAAICTVAAIIARLRKSSEPCALLMPSFFALSAPLVWMGFDAYFFDDFLFTYNEVLSWSALSGSATDIAHWKEIAIDCIQWTAISTETLGMGFLVASLVGCWLARGRRFKPMLWMPLCLFTWILALFAARVFGIDAQHRLAIPAYMTLWPFVGGTLAASLALVPYREAPARKTYLALITIVVLGKASFDLSEYRVAVTRIHEPTLAMISSVRNHKNESKNEPATARRWLIDNDLASRMVLEADLDRSKVGILQRTSESDMGPLKWDGIVIDDRLGSRPQRTPKDLAIQEFFSKCQALFQAPGCRVGIRQP